VNIESYVEFGCNEYFVVFGTDIVSNEPNDFREAESSKTEADFSKKQRLVLRVVQPRVLCFNDHTEIIYATNWFVSWVA